MMGEEKKEFNTGATTGVKIVGGIPIKTIESGVKIVGGHRPADEITVLDKKVEDKK